jgi:homoserine dehydrogenase
MMKRVKIIVCGIGRVGREFIQLLADGADVFEKRYGLHFIICAAADIGGAAITESETGLDAQQLLTHIRNGGFVENFGRYGQPGLSSEQAIRQGHADALIETTPTNLTDGEPAKTHVLAAIEKQMEVVSANKGPFVLFYRELHESARKNNCGLHISAAAAAALPTLDVGRVCLAGTRVLSIEGILNGTTNYILTQMSHEGTSYQSALKQAQEMGIAETNPDYDVQGKDTANKMILICNRVFKAYFGLSDIRIQGITEVTQEDITQAARQGKVIKLIGTAALSDEEMLLRVAPKLLDKGHPLAGVNGSEKAITYVTDTMGTITVTGGKSSPVGAAAALLKDLINAYV